ncbi:NRPS [Arthroderma sp. PD_2]|nr:NRPS [Arthroderma sp. PD_2]
MKLSNLARKHDLSLTVQDITQHRWICSMALCMRPIRTSWEPMTPFSLIKSYQLSSLLAQAASTCGISTDEIMDIYPCTPLQIELFALTMKQPQAYIKRSVFDVPTHLDFIKLRHAWDTIIGLHAILRTRYVDIEGLGLLQVVVKAHVWDTADTITSYLAENPVHADLGRPLSQLAIIRAQSAPKVVWTIHHAMYDGWSIQLIEDQLCRAYHDQQIPQSPPFSTFVHYLLSRDPNSARQFWKSELAGCASATVYPKLPEPSYQVQPSRTYRRTLRTPVATGVNLQSIIHVAWALILSQITEAKDVVFAATLAGRDALLPGIEQMVGPTIAPVPIRIQLGQPEQTVEDLIRILERKIAALAPYQHVGIKTIGLIDPHTRAACRFQTLIVVNPPDGVGFGDANAIRTATYEVSNQQPFHTFGLVLFFTPAQKGLDLEVVFDPLLLDSREVERLSGRFQAVISAVGAGYISDLRVGNIECLGEEDKEDILSWNSPLPVPNERVVHDIILETAMNRADKVAIEAWDCSVTYAELETLSNHLAGHLRGLGVRRGSIVPILSPKSGYVAVATLGVLRAGAAILPLDDTQPLGRLQNIIRQVNPDVILSAKACTSLASRLRAASVLFIEDGLIASSKNNTDILDLPRPGDLACILFTSGTTGTPKGVLQTHRVLSSAILHQAAVSGFGETTRAFEFASYSFDVSWNMIFKVLAVGGTLCVPQENDRRNDLVGSLNRAAATLTELTPSIARIISPDQLTALETLILSGEAVDIREFKHWGPRIRVVICYGPSECTSVATLNPAGSQDHGIGKGTSCLTWIVNPCDHRQLMPVGAIGEIVVEGPIVGKGYHDNELLTNASYISGLPWQEGRNGFAFKSGDLARYDSHGNLHFISRKDTQIKLRGQRVELEEVQHHVRLMMRGLVGQVICAAVGSGKQQKLVALVCHDVDTAETTASEPCILIAPASAVLACLETLDERLGAILPNYMIPAIYYFIPSIPRTANGKVDRWQLENLARQADPELGYRGRQSQPAARRPPSTPAEVQMQRLWAAELDIAEDAIGADDHFFNMNGDSISAMKLVAAARRQGYELQVSDIFAYPKLSELSLKLQKRDIVEFSAPTDLPFSLLDDTVDTAVIGREVAGLCGLPNPFCVEDIYPCTPLQEMMLAATIKDPMAFISRRLFRVPPDVDSRRLCSAWQTVVARNRILRTRLVDVRGQGPCQVVIRDQFSWEVYPTTHAFLDHENETCMGPGTPLTRWALIEGSGERSLVWVIHHATYDGWILSAIEDEVRKVYLKETLPPPQPDLRPLIRYLIDQDTCASAAFWAQELKDSHESSIFPSLPSRYYQPCPLGYVESSMEIIEISPTVNLPALLYCSWSLLLSCLSGSQKITFGTIRTGRTAPVNNIDRLMGPTITTVPLVVDVDPSLCVQDLMLRSTEQLYRIILHEHLGVSAIRRVNSDTSEACRFQTVLVIQPVIAQGKSELQTFMEELDETKVEGFPNQHAVLNQYGLMIEVLPSSTKLGLRASFDSTLISIVQMERLIEQWEQIIQLLLNAINEAPRTPVTELDLLCRQHLDDIWTWNETVPDSVNDRFVHHTISEVALIQPKALAIDAWDGRLTYSELDLLSSRLARQLLLAGVGPGCFVPILFPKSLWANVSMLAVMKAGGAFVPLDAGHPEGHRRAIMQLVNPNLILCSTETRDSAARLAPVTLLVDRSLQHANGLSNDQDTRSTIHAINHRKNLTPWDPVYAAFTSGSTGTAKGVQITHANLATAIRYQAGPQGYEIGPESRTLDSSSYAFDACVCNCFYTLTQGGCLCVPNDESLNGDLSGFLRDYRVNWAQLVPSVARTLAASTLPNLNTLVLTGETLLPSDIDAWSRRVRLFNAYGPTECTILCSISPQITDSTLYGAIGRGHGANLWLTEIGNPDRLAPIGGVGEILIEGPLVGAGYLGLDKFPLVVNPSWLLRGSSQVRGRQGSLFRTGDQARYADDGTVIFMGRIGSEVKLRGQRVDVMGVQDLVQRWAPTGLEIVAEITELQSATQQQPRQMLLLFANQIATACATDQSSLEQKLRPILPGLRNTLEAALPSYTQPEAFACIESIPKTRSGKTDRRRLRRIGEQLQLAQLIWIRADYTLAVKRLPTTPEEKTLAGLWANVLALEEASIGCEDDFFVLGGDSLGVMRLTTAAHDCGISLPPKEVFEYPRLAELAHRMAILGVFPREKGVTAAPVYAPFSLISDISDPATFIRDHIAPTLDIPVDQVQDIVPANGFQVDYINNEEEPLGLLYAYLDISSRVSWPRFIEACRTVLQEFQGFRARFVSHEGQYYQVLLRQAPLIAKEVVTMEQITTFSNQFCPHDSHNTAVSDVLTKLTLVNSGAPLRRVILRLSHMQYDGWCTVRILESIARVYNDRKIEPTAKWTSLLHYRQQRADASRQYWEDLLQGSANITPPLVFLPGGTQKRTLRTFTLPNFHSSGNNRRTRPTVVINVAWALVLQQLVGHEDVVFGNVTTGRNGDMPGLNSVIGPCVNMLPVRLRLGSYDSASTRQQYLCRLVEASAQQVNERTAFEGLDWEEVVKRCTDWPARTRYASAVHFRNMSFEPQLDLGGEQLTVAWYEHVVAPHWTSVLACPEEGFLRLWLLANPKEIGDEGADKILRMLVSHIEEILLALQNIV